MPRELLLTAPRLLTLAEYAEPQLRPGEVRAAAVAGSISAGTELALFRGTSPFDTRRFDLDLRLFVDVAPGAAYPARLGYEWVGVVRDAAPDVTSVTIGDRVHLPLPHRETQTVLVTTAATVPWLLLPPGLDAEQATLLQSTTIALQAVRDANIAAGDDVAVFGLGTFGLLAVQLARLDGAGSIVAVDPIPARRELARRFGADVVLDPLNVDPGLEIKSGSARRGVDVAIEFSGRYDALHQALRSVRVGGTVVAAGFYVGGAGDLRLGEEWLHNRLTMVASMQGWGVPPRDAAWDRRRLRQAALELLVARRLDVGELLTHRVAFESAAEAFALLEEHPEQTLRVVLTY